MSFQDIYGHIREKEILRRAASVGKAAHSLLFSGPEGIGKRLAALAFARALNCAAVSEGDACGECADCAGMESGTHPNLIEIWPTVKVKENEYENALDGEGLVRIHQVRDIQNVIKYRVESGKKAVIVNFAEKLMPQAANAFLKTLEEPPPDTVIILLTSAASALLPTILSRCQRINFRPLPDEAVSAFLFEKKGLSPDDTAMIVRLCSGSISSALRYVEGGALEKRNEVLERLNRVRPGETDEVLKLAEDLSRRDDLPEMLEYMKVWYRDMAVSREGAPGLAVNRDMPGYIGRESGGPVRPWDCFSMIENARRDIMPPRYANKQLTIEALLLGILG